MMKYPIFNIQILSFSNGHELKTVKGSVNLTCEVQCRGPVNTVNIFKLNLYV